MGITYKDVQWAETGERLTAETFEKYRKQGGMPAAFPSASAIFMLREGYPAQLEMAAIRGFPPVIEEHHARPTYAESLRANR
jgi:hypothetical protein